MVIVTELSWTIASFGFPWVQKRDERGRGSDGSAASGWELGSLRKYAVVGCRPGVIQRDGTWAPATGHRFLDFMLHCVTFCCGSTQVGLPRSRHPATVTRRRLSISCCIALHLLHRSDWARRESLPAAVGIVKEHGWSWQNTLRRVRGGFSDREVPLPDIRVARGFCEIGEMDLAWRLFSVD